MSNNSDDGFGLMVRALLKNAVLPDSKNERSGELVILLLLGVLTFVGAEAVKVTFRTNFGRETLNIGKIVVCSLVFWGIAYLSYGYYLKTDNTDPKEFLTMGYPSTFFFTTIFYLTYGLFVLLKGLLEVSKANRQTNIHPLYNGDSYLSIVLNKKNRSRTQNLEEPFLVLSIGILFSGYNFLLGLPLVFCAISVWAYQLYMDLLGHNHVDKVLEEQGYSKQQGEQFTEIIS